MSYQEVSHCMFAISMYAKKHVSSYIVTSIVSWLGPSRCARTHTKTRTHRHWNRNTNDIQWKWLPHIAIHYLYSTVSAYRSVWYEHREDIMDIPQVDASLTLLLFLEHPCASGRNFATCFNLPSMKSLVSMRHDPLVLLQKWGTFGDIFWRCFCLLVENSFEVSHCFSKLFLHS